MPDANALRQRRHDSCKATAGCSRCGAWAGRACHELRAPYNSPIYQKQAIQNATTAGISMGKTMLQTAAVLRDLRGFSNGRVIGGLHAARWTAWNNRSAIERLGEITER